MPDKETCVSLNGNQKLSEESCTNKNTLVCSIPLCPGKNLLKVSDWRVSFCNFQMIFLKSKISDADRMNVHQLAIPVGKNSRESAIFGAEKRWSGQQLSRDVGAWEVT